MELANYCRSWQSSRPSAIHRCVAYASGTSRSRLRERQRDVRLISTLLFATAASSFKRNRSSLRIHRSNAEAEKEAADDRTFSYGTKKSSPSIAFPLEAYEDLAKVSRSLWPLLMSAAQAELIDPVSGDGADLSSTLANAAKGLAAWQTSLLKGKVWSDTEGANWPCDEGLRSEWTNLLQNLKLPHFMMRYPKLVDPLLANLLETVEQFHRESAQDSQKQKGAEADSKGSADADSQGSDDAEDEEADGTQNEQNDQEEAKKYV